MGQKPTRAPRLEPEARRRQILEATVEAVDEHGFQDLTIDSVAKAAGIARPVIYDLFGNLDGLLDALVEETDRRALGAIEGVLPDPSAGKPPDALLGTAVSGFLEAVQADPGIWRIVLLPPDGTPVSVRGRVERRRAEIAAQISDIVESVADRFGMLDGVDFPMLARVLIGIAEDMGRLVLERPQSYTPERLGEALAQVARLVPAQPRPEPEAGE